MPGRPLAERITLPASARSRSSLSPGEEMDAEAARKGIDRYRPGGGGGGRGSRSRSPLHRGGRRDNGRRPGARGRDAGGRGGDGGSRPGRSGRPRKTQDELDAEMEDYFGANSGSGSRGGGRQEAAAAAPATNGFAAAGDTQAGTEDMDMIE